MGHKENEKLTELSAALDALNRGEQHASGDEETKELAEVALLLKRTGPPPAMLAGLVDKLGDELAAKRKRRRLWLTSGAAGTAAAAMLVFAFNLGPSAPPQPQLTIPPAGSVVIESIPAPQQANDSAAGVAKADKVKDESAKAKQPALTADTAPAPVREAAPPPVHDRPVAAPAEGGRNEQRLMMAKVPEKVADKQAKAPAVPAAGYLAWPGRQPDEVTVDKATATIRQVYGHGDAAIVITQGAAPAGAKAALVEADAPAGVGAAKGKANKVTVTVKDTAVTVEGNLPEDELQKIARSLE